MVDDSKAPDVDAVAAALGSAHLLFATGPALSRGLAFNGLQPLREKGEELLPALMTLVDHASPYVRAGVAGMLPFADSEPTADGATVRALLKLTSDQDPLVQDWAAAALVALEEADSPEIRDALRTLLQETDTVGAYPAAEAALALAVRGDAHVVPVIACRLEDGVGKLWLTAAAVTRSPLLLERLLALSKPDEDPTDPWVSALQDAISSCSPDPSNTGTP